MTLKLTLTNPHKSHDAHEEMYERLKVE